MDKIKVIARAKWLIGDQEVILNLHKDNTYSYYDSKTESIVHGSYHDVLNSLGVKVI